MFPAHYPKSKLGFSWQELGCLARSLGFHQDCLKTSLPNEIQNDSMRAGLTLKELDRMIASKYYLVCLDQTYNVHSDDWNIRVLQKAAKLVSARFVRMDCVYVLSFSGLMDIRVAYQLYEGRDTNGMNIDQRTLTRCFKMCNRAIAPLKLMHRLKHFKSSLEVEGRIQLHEFLDLVLWSDQQEPVIVRYPTTYSVTERALFKMTDFNEIFEHHDLKLANALDQLYLQDEWSFSVPVGGVRDRQPVKDGVMIADKTRRTQASLNRTCARTIRPQIHKSERAVQLSETGHLLDSRPQSAPELRHLVGSGSRVGSSLESRPRTANATTLETYMPELLNTRWHGENQPYTRENYRPPSSAYSRSQTPVTVPHEAVVRAKANVRELKFDESVCIERHRYRANRNLEFLRPGILERLANRPKSSALSAPVPPKQPRTTRPDPRFLEYISSRPGRQPSPCHKKACDARLRSLGRKVI